MRATPARTVPTGSAVRLLALAVLLLGNMSCSQGSLPGTPSPLLVGGGGARYNGSITYRRLAGSHTFSEAAQTLDLSLVMTSGGQVTGRFQTIQNNGTLAGEVSGNLADGFLDATLLVSLRAQAPGGEMVTCEGRGRVSGRLFGINLAWSTSSISYENCPGLVARADVQAVAVSPIPGPAGNRANLFVAVPGGTRVTPGICVGGASGFPFVVEIRETAGIDVTFDDTFRVEESGETRGVTVHVFDMPFTGMRGGARLTYQACGRAVGTYQAFFSGTDANGNRFRIASPVVAFGESGDFGESFPQFVRPGLAPR